MKKLALILIIAAFCQSALGANRDVCSTCAYTTIQNAVDSSVNGDTIRIAGGTYAEEIYFSTNSLVVRIEGGYNASFTARDSESVVNGRFQIGFSSASSVEIDGLTIVNAATQAIYTSGTATDLTVTNCTIHNAASAGIYAYNPGNITVDSCEIYSNENPGGIAIQRLSIGKAVTITNNTIHANICSACSGIYILNIQSEDVVQGNTIFGNQQGVSYLASDASKSPLIVNNRIYLNHEYGLIASHGSSIIKNNFFYRNGVSGIYNYSVDSPQIVNNLFASNGPYGFGVRLDIGSGAPLIKNNIFYDEFHGLYLDLSLPGTPSSVDHNAFFHDQILDYRDLRTGNNETPGDYNDINHFSYTNSNLVIDPRFVDPENDNYTLQSDSFLIDEGDPGSDYTLEPAPNGGRINIGPQGGTAGANISPAIPSIANLSAAQSGNDVVITFDTNTASHELWIKLEYYDGATYQVIAPSGLSADNYSVGYQRGRIVAGVGQSLVWSGAASTFGAGTQSTRIRATLEHGASSASQISSEISLNFSVPTATPTPTGIPSLTPSPTPSLSPTPIPTSTPSITPTSSATAAPTARPKSPGVTAQNTSFRIGAHMRLPLKIHDEDSAQVSVQLTMRFLRTNMRRRIRDVVISLPVRVPYRLDLGKVRLAKGNWEYCVRIRDDTGLLSPRSCAVLVVEPKKLALRR